MENYLLNLDTNKFGIEELKALEFLFDELLNPRSEKTVKELMENFNIRINVDTLRSKIKKQIEKETGE